MIKIALCFIISYEHILNKENIWKEWIEYNKDIINIYFYYSNYEKIQSEWIKKYCIPIKYIKETSYYHIIPAYINLMCYAKYHDKNNRWFCFLTDSCCPIMYPLLFRKLFYENYNKTILKWDYPNWDIYYHKRANLHLLDKKYRLKNTPYFIMSRENINDCLYFVKSQKNTFIAISNGIIANESLFAIILKYYNNLKYVINENSTITDWGRMSGPSNPYVFKEFNEENKNFIIKNKTKYSIFLRKVHQLFSDIQLKKIIYNYDEDEIKKIKYICFYYEVIYRIYDYRYFAIFLFSILLLSLFEKNIKLAILNNIYVSL